MDEDRDDSSIRSRSYSAQNEAFTEEFDPSLPGPIGPPLANQRSPNILVDISKPRVPPCSSSLPTPTILEDLRARAKKAQSSSAWTMEPFTSTHADLFLPNPDLPRRIPQSMDSFTRASPNILSLGGAEPGCSTHLLSDNRSRAPSCSRSTPPAHLPHPLCTQFTLSQSEIGFLYWNWAAVRLACIMAFFSCLAAMLCVVVGMLIASPFPCDPPHHWWQGAVFYEIFPASFQDTDGDGFGDLRGIIERLDYVESLNVNAIRLNSIFSALDYPLEYEHIIDFTNVDPHLGRMDDFRALIREAHRRNLRVVLDLNPAISSDQHTWALHWQRGMAGYQDFYASANRSKAPPEMEDNEGPPPSEWQLPQRTFGGHYYLNWSSPSVQREIQSALSFWLENGVDGFYLKHLDRLQVNTAVDIFHILRQWRDELDRKSNRRSSYGGKVLITSMKFAEYLKNSGSPVMNSVLELVDLLDVPLYVEFNGSVAISRQIARAQAWRTFPTFPWVTWHLGSSDTFRLASRIDPGLSTAAFFLLMMLPGSVSIFYGDEIGIKDSYDVVTNRMFRGGQLGPMQWTPAPNGNFTNVTSPWLPPHPEHEQQNVQMQEDRISILSQLAKLRNSTVAVAMDGVMEGRVWKSGYRVPAVDSAVLTMERFYPRRSRLLLCANFGTMDERRDFSHLFFEMRVLMSSDGKAAGRMNFRNLTLDSGEVIIGDLTI